MRIYATDADLASWTGTDAPANAASLLRSASARIERAARHARYSTDAAGMPTDPGIRTAFTEATAAQAAYWAALRINPALGAAGLPASVASKSIAGASVSYAANAAAEEARLNAVDALAPDAHDVLAQAGLTDGTVRAL